MFKKVNADEKQPKKSLTKKMHKISYDDRLTRASASIDLMKSSKFVDLGDGYVKPIESDNEKLSK